MNVEKLLQALDTIQVVGEAFGRIPEEQAKCVEAHAHMAITAMYLVELAKYLQDGMEPYDALLKTARGDTPLTDLGAKESSVTLIKLLRPQAPSPDCGFRRT